MSASMTSLNELLLFSTLLLLAETGSGALTPMNYWNKVFPNTPMPNAIEAFLPSRELSELARDYKRLMVSQSSQFRILWRDLWAGMLHNHDPKPFVAHQYHSKHLSSNDAFLFFLEKDLEPGSKVNLTMISPLKHIGLSTGPTFLPREEAQAIPFSTSNLTDILGMFSIEPDSYKAYLVRQALHDCEMPPIKGEAKYCATSLESMIDFAIYQLGTHDIHVLATSVINKEDKVQARVYRVCVDGMKMNSGKVVTCHNMLYPYTVFYCHNLAETRSYIVPLVADDGSKVNAVAVCHFNTSTWNPMHVSFQILGVKPGTIPICHLLSEGLSWIPS